MFVNIGSEIFVTIIFVLFGICLYFLGYFHSERKFYLANKFCKWKLIGERDNGKLYKSDCCKEHSSMIIFNYEAKPKECFTCKKKIKFISNEK